METHSPWHAASFPTATHPLLNGYATSPLEPVPEFEDRDYAEVTDYSVPRPSIVVTQVSPPYANTPFANTPPFMVKLPAGNPTYENTMF